jgi:predicted small secreted protein
MAKRKKRNIRIAKGSYIERQTIQCPKEKRETFAEQRSLTSNDRQYNGQKKKEKHSQSKGVLHRTTENTMAKRKKRNIRRAKGSYIEQQTIQWPKEEREKFAEQRGLTSNVRPLCCANVSLFSFGHCIVCRSM